MDELRETFTSTGSKLFYHQQVMENLRNGKGTPVTTHLLPCDRCNHFCAFCSVATREGDTLSMALMRDYLGQLVPLGLKSVIISGGGNPILYRDLETKEGFNELVEMIHGFGLEIGLITNGTKMKTYPDGRKSYLTVKPETLDKMTWIRVSFSGLDHEEREVFIPDINPELTTLGGSWVAHDRFIEPLELNHGKVSTEYDLRTPLAPGDGRAIYFEDELPWIEEQIAALVQRHPFRYVRVLPNCLEPDKIQHRASQLRAMALRINPEVVFVQEKPPRQPKICLKGYGHPVLSSDAYVYPCDSVVLNRDAGHKFAEPWRICHASEIGKFYADPIRANVKSGLCPNCVFSDQVDLLARVAFDKITTPPPAIKPEHANFV